MATVRGPRRLVAADQRDLFGRVRPLSWHRDGPASELSAAYRQHLLSYAVRQARTRLGLTSEEVALRTGLGVETLRRKLRGEAWLSWTDASLLALAFPDDPILPAADEVLPPAV